MNSRTVYILFQEDDYDWYVVGVYENIQKAGRELRRCLKDYDQNYYLKSFVLE